VPRKATAEPKEAELSSILHPVKSSVVEPVLRISNQSAL